MIRPLRRLHGRAVTVFWLLPPLVALAMLGRYLS